MLRYYSSRELSHRLQSPLNRWKRWSREFLPPDPLGGLQSGYARQFSTREAFIVYLGGFLVAGLGFAIPQARQIIEDLNDWLKKIVFDGYLMGRRAEDADMPAEWTRYEVHIFGMVGPSSRMSGKLTYRIREVLTRSRNANGDWVEIYKEVGFKGLLDTPPSGYPTVRCLLDITDLAEFFVRRAKS